MWEIDQIRGRVGQLGKLGPNGMLAATVEGTPYLIGITEQQQRELEPYVGSHLLTLSIERDLGKLAIGEAGARLLSFSVIGKGSFADNLRKISTELDSLFEGVDDPHDILS